MVAPLVAFLDWQSGVPDLEHDLRHGHEGGEPGQNLGFPGGAEFLELEVTLQTMAQGHGLTL